MTARRHSTAYSMADTAVFATFLLHVGENGSSATAHQTGKTELMRPAAWPNASRLTPTEVPATAAQQEHH